MRRIMKAANRNCAKRVAGYIADYDSVMCNGMDDKTTLADILCDLRHFADSKQIDFEEANKRAAHAYRLEVNRIK